MYGIIDFYRACKAKEIHPVISCEVYPAPHFRFARSYQEGKNHSHLILHFLYFERFLNPERISMPDIDVDFCYSRRQKVIDYVTRKYGRDCVCQIVTVDTLGAKTLFGIRKRFL